MKHGYFSTDPAVQFENNWVFETYDDLYEPWRGKIAGGPAPDSEDGKKVIEGLCKFYDAIENRAKDGRKYLAGNCITACDFALLSHDVSQISNPYQKNVELMKVISAELDKRSNLRRCIDNLKNEPHLNQYINKWWSYKMPF